MPFANLRELSEIIDDVNAPFPQRAAKLMTYEAALHLMTGRTLEELASERNVMIDTEELEGYADQLRKIGIEDYAKRAYGGEDPEKVDLTALKYQYFLYQSLKLLDHPEGTHLLNLQDKLRKELQGWERDGKVPAQDHWLSQYSSQEAARQTELKEEDKPVYEYEASDEVWKDYIAGAFTRKGWGARPLTADTVNKIKKDFVFDKLTLRNKRTVEKLQRGDLDAVGKARRSTEKSFTFLRPQDLAAAQAAAKNLNRRMNLDNPTANSREWREVKKAVFSFQTAEDPEAAARASAEVLLAVEKFTKGKKNAHQSEEVSQCVNMALEALGTTIPSAAKNPNVRPLVDRFNEVRRHRLQFGSMVELQDNGALSRDVPDSELIAPWKEKMETFLKDELQRQEVKDSVQPVSDEAKALESMAVAIALEEIPRGKITVRRQLEGRIEELKKDPVLTEMAHGAATDPRKAGELAANAGSAVSFRLYMDASYKQALREKQQKEGVPDFDEALRRKQEEIEKLKAEQARLEQQHRENEQKRRQAQENPEQRHIEDSEAKLNRELDGFGDDYFKLGGYEPEQAKPLFAEMLALKELKEKQKTGGKIKPNELRECTEKRMKDPVVERMANTLPNDPKFRDLIGECKKRNHSPLPAMTAYLGRAYEAYSKGKTISECYAEQREPMRQLSGVLDEGTKPTPRQAARLVATLIAVREAETAAGGKDVPVDEKKLQQRIAELEKEPDVQKTGSDLLGKKYQEYLSNMANEKQAPERHIAELLYDPFKKRHPDPVGEPEGPKPAEEIKQEEVRQAGDGVPVA